MKKTSQVNNKSCCMIYNHEEICSENKNAISRTNNDFQQCIWQQRFPYSQSHERTFSPYSL